jgi:hypothetical protein
MKGLALHSLRLGLERVEPDSTNPVETIDWQPKLEPFMAHLANFYDLPFDFQKKYHELRLGYLVNFSFDELCKLKYSSGLSKHGTVEKLFETKAQYEIVRKISSSMWRWGYGTGTWNEIVDTHTHIRHFSFGDIPHMEIRLDHSTYNNPFGYSKYSRLFLDGVFGFLVYYKQKHILTISFSIAEGRKVLIQQIQSTCKTGNRGLYKLPAHRVEYIVSLFVKNFPGYELYLVDGESLSLKNLRDYRNALEWRRKILAEKQSHRSQRYLKDLREDCRELQQRIKHLCFRKAEIAAFYQDVGKYQLGSTPLVLNTIKHWPLSTVQTMKCNA